MSSELDYNIKHFNDLFIENLSTILVVKKPDDVPSHNVSMTAKKDDDEQMAKEDDDASSSSSLSDNEGAKNEAE